MASVITALREYGKGVPQLMKIIETRLAAIKVMDQKEEKKIDPELSQAMMTALNMYYGTTDGETAALNTQMMKNLIAKMLKADVLAELLYNISYLEFEAKKAVGYIGEYILSHDKKSEDSKAGSVPVAAQYVISRPKMLTQLAACYTDPDVGVVVSCHRFLGACVKSEHVCKAILNHEPSLVMPFFEYIQLPNFDVSGPAFTTFTALFTEHAEMGAQYLLAHYDAFFKEYNALLHHENFVIKKQAFEFLAKLLMTRTQANYKLLLKYVDQPSNLVITMSALRSKTYATQLVVFHVLKIFIANPKKGLPVLKVLHSNQKQLISFINRFHQGQSNEHLIKDKEECVDQLNGLDQALAQWYAEHPEIKALEEKKREAAAAVEAQTATPPVEKTKEHSAKSEAVKEPVQVAAPPATEPAV